MEIRKQIIIIDDYSTDGTREMLRRDVENQFPDVVVLYQNVNSGKGACIRLAIPKLTGEFAIIQDGDLEYDPNDYHRILGAFEDPLISAVYGSRFMEEWPPMKLPNKIVNKLLATMVRVFYRIPMTDEATCYKAFRTYILQSIPLECSRFEFCPEITAKLARSKHQIAEVPIQYKARTILQGKKIRWTDGVVAIGTLLRYVFWRRGN